MKAKYLTTDYPLFLLTTGLRVVLTIVFRLLLPSSLISCQVSRCDRGVGCRTVGQADLRSAALSTASNSCISSRISCFLSRNSAAVLGRGCPSLHLCSACCCPLKSLEQLTVCSAATSGQLAYGCPAFTTRYRGKY